MEKEIKIVPPEGYEIDKDKSTFECIKFKRVIKRWRDDIYKGVKGFYIDYFSDIEQSDKLHNNNKDSYKLFATRKQAKSALAMARISQIMANDERFGGVVTDEEFKDMDRWIYSINRNMNKIAMYQGTCGIDHFLSFHTAEQRDLFLKENEDLIRDYLMID